MLKRLMHGFVLLLLISALALTVQAQEGFVELDGCEDVAFTVEEDFIPHNRGVVPDGLEYISDGDLLGRHQVCARNWQLLEPFGLNRFGDVGLDAVDILNYEMGIVAFSVELDFTEENLSDGDLLITTGAIIPYWVFAQGFDVRHNVGLDAVHFTGEADALVDFSREAADIARDEWSIDLIHELLENYDLDIWYSFEGTIGEFPEVILDGDILSLRFNSVVIPQEALFPSAIPAGIPRRGVDYGVDALTGEREINRRTVMFSTELDNHTSIMATDGDVISPTGTIAATNLDLIAEYEPQAEMGLDGLWMYEIQPSTENCIRFETATLGATFSNGDSYSEAGHTMHFVEFVWSDGTVFPDGTGMIDNMNLAGGAGQDLNTNNITGLFEFATPVSQVSLNYGAHGGNLNLNVNGDLANFDDISSLPTMLGGATITHGMSTGVMTATGTIEIFAIGGQELWIDNICFSD